MAIIALLLLWRLKVRVQTSYNTQYKLAISDEQAKINTCQIEFYR